MAKVQGKKSAAGKKSSATKSAVRAKSAKPAPKRPAKTTAKKAVKGSAKTKKPVKKTAQKPAAKPKVTAKGATPAKATKPTKTAKPAPPAKATAGKAKALAKTAVKTAVKPVVKTPKGAAKAAAPSASAAVAPKAAPPAVEDKKRRRTRPKVSSSGGATAAWFSKPGERPRASSFIPAPPRAEAPSLVAAPPASSDRLVSHDELTEFVVRTVPVRIDVEAGGGRIFLGTFPDSVVLKPGEGIEWDFRYVNGADVMIDELIIEFDKPSPFPQTIFRSRRPGSNRPHRQLSGAVQKSAAGKQVRYIVRALNTFRTEMATVQPSVTVQL
jgi:hypothetical protein